MSDVDDTENEANDEVLQCCAELQDVDMIESLPISPETLAKMQRENRQRPLTSGA
eukprot:m.35199 g.35199  ORF g.35199 m.35199 type:complete len:55 (+) comp32076_c0_seq1:369-533(+)